MATDINKLVGEMKELLKKHGVFDASIELTYPNVINLGAELNLDNNMFRENRVFGLSVSFEMENVYFNDTKLSYKCNAKG